MTLCVRLWNSSNGKDMRIMIMLSCEKRCRHIVDIFYLPGEHPTNIYVIMFPSFLYRMVSHGKIDWYWLNYSYVNRSSYVRITWISSTRTRCRPYKFHEFNWRIGADVLTIRYIVGSTLQQGAFGAAGGGGGCRVKKHQNLGSGLPLLRPTKPSILLWLRSWY